MTREEAIAILQEKYDYCKSFYDLAAHPEEDYPEMAKYLQALQIALTALRPVSRERVEKVWRGEWIGSGDGYADGELVYDTWTCSECGHVIDEEDDPDMLPQFCPKCYAAMTDEAVQMVMRRLEGMDNGTVPCDNA